MASFRNEMDYWGTGFLVKLRNFPCYEDEGGYAPDFPLLTLQKIIAYHVLRKSFLLTGNELAFLRATADLNRSESAKKLGITRRTLINWEEQLDEPIRAASLAQLSIKLFYLTWIFPGEKTIESELIQINTKENDGPIAIDYRSVNGLLPALSQTERESGIKFELDTPEAQSASPR